MIYLARPVWIADGGFPRWGLPAWASAFRDDRTLLQMAAPGNRDGDRAGRGFYIGPDDPAKVKDDQAIPLGDLDTELTPEQKTLLDVSGVTTLRQALLVKAVFGDTPPALARGAIVEIGIGRQRIRREMKPGSDGWIRVQARLKSEVLSAPLEKQAALITDRLQKLGLPITREAAHEYLDLDRDPGIKQTIKGDTFNRGTDVAIASHTSTGTYGGNTYTSLINLNMRVDNGGAAGRAYCSTLLSESRLNGDMSSVDFQTSFNAMFISAVTGRYIGAITRKDSSATRTFMAGYWSPDLSPSRYSLNKCVSGTYSELASSNQTFTADSYRTITFRSVGDDHTIYDNGVAVVTDNDPSVSSGTRGGMAGGSGNVAHYIVMQQLLITDEISAGGILRQMMMHH